MIIVALNGPIGAGKSTLAGALAKLGWLACSTSDWLRREWYRAGNGSPSRAELVAIGRTLDQTGPGWILDLVAYTIGSVSDWETRTTPGAVIDAVRVGTQLDTLIRHPGTRVVVVSVGVDRGVLHNRILDRDGKVPEDVWTGENSASRANLFLDTTEVAPETLARMVHDYCQSQPGRGLAVVPPDPGLPPHLQSMADLVPDKLAAPVYDSQAHYAASLGRGMTVHRPRTRYRDRRPACPVDVVIGGQYGSEGKGHLASFISPRYGLLVRSGGPNAGHKTWEEPILRPEEIGITGRVTEPRMTYTFHHLPSGTRRNRQARIAIAAGAALWLPKFMEEVDQCDAWDRLTIDPHAIIVEQSDRDAEGVGVGSIGTTAQGVGSAASRRILRGMGSTPVRTAADVPELRPYLGNVSELVGRYTDGAHGPTRVLLEGTQGSGLSLFHGPYPYCTSRDTNVAGLLSEVGVAPAAVDRVLLVCRTYPIRVAGNSGPMGGLETTWEKVGARADVDPDTLRELERTTTTERLRRVAEFDWTLFRSAVRLNMPTDIGLTFADYLSPFNAGARSEEELTPTTREFIRELGSVARVSLISTGFGPADRTIIDNGWTR